MLYGENIILFYIKCSVRISEQFTFSSYFLKWKQMLTIWILVAKRIIIFEDRNIIVEKHFRMTIMKHIYLVSDLLFSPNQIAVVFS